MLFHDPMVCAENKRLCVGHQDVDPLEDVIVRFALLGIDHDRDMFMAEFLGDVEGWQSVGFDRLVANHPFLKHGFDVITVNFFEHFHPREGDRLFPCSGHDENGDFGGTATSLVAALLGTAIEEGVIDLDQACELVASVSCLHGLANLVQHGPRAFEANVDLSGQGKSRKTTLVRRYQVDGPEPLNERRPRRMHDRSCGKRSLELALNALIQRTLFKVIGFMVSTSGTVEALGPAQFKQAFPAGLFVPKPALEGDQVHIVVGLGHGDSSQPSRFLADSMKIAERRQ